jgi:hypothetical protein
MSRPTPASASTCCSADRAYGHSGAQMTQAWSHGPSMVLELKREMSMRSRANEPLPDQCRGDVLLRFSQRPASMKARHFATISALMAACTCACGQEAPRPVPADPGALQAPLTTDPEIAKRPPANVDPKAVERPPSNVDPEMAKKPPTERDGRPEGKEAVPEKRSREDDCRGPAELCKQDSAR